MLLGLHTRCDLLSDRHENCRRPGRKRTAQKSVALQVHWMRHSWPSRYSAVCPSIGLRSRHQRHCCWSTTYTARIRGPWMVTNSTGHRWASILDSLSRWHMRRCLRWGLQWLRFSMGSRLGLECLAPAQLRPIRAVLCYRLTMGSPNYRTIAVVSAGSWNRLGRSDLRSRSRKWMLGWQLG